MPSPRILHLTDFHVGTADNGARLKSLLDHLAGPGREQLGERCVVVVSGDMAHTPEPKHLEEASRLLQAFQQSTGLPVLVVPGNHEMEEYDLPRIGHTPGSWKSQKRRFAKIFAWAVYRPGAHPWLETRTVPMEGLPDLYYRIDIAHGAAGETLALFGLDSLAEDALLAKGRLGEEQLAALTTDLIVTRAQTGEAAKICLYLHHSPVYHFPGMTLSDAKEFDQALQSADVGIDALLFGHTHKGERHRHPIFLGAEDPCGIPVVLDGGCLEPGTLTLSERLGELLGADANRRAYRIVDLWTSPRVKALP